MGRENVKNIQKTNKICCCFGGENLKLLGGGGISPLKALKKKTLDRVLHLLMLATKHIYAELSYHTGVSHGIAYVSNMHDEVNFI